MGKQDRDSIIKNDCPLEYFWPIEIVLNVSYTFYP